MSNGFDPIKKHFGELIQYIVVDVKDKYHILSYIFFSKINFSMENETFDQSSALSGNIEIIRVHPDY